MKKNLSHLTICLSKDYVPIRKMGPEWQGISPEAMKVLTIEEAEYFFELYKMTRFYYEQIGVN